MSLRVPTFPAGPGRNQEGPGVPLPYSDVSRPPTLLTLSPTDTGHLLCQGTPASLLPLRSLSFLRGHFREDWYL